MKSLTNIQARVLEYYVRFVEERGTQPTIRQVCGYFGYKSPNGIYCHLIALEKKGKIILNPDGKGRNRMVQFVGVRFQRVLTPEQS